MNTESQEPRMTDHQLLEEAKKHTAHKWPAAQSGEKPYCDYCSTSWPCLTARLADSLESAKANAWDEGWNALEMWTGEEADAVNPYRKNASTE